MSFTSAFNKIAFDTAKVMPAIKKGLSEAKTLGGAALRGLKSSGGETIGDSLKLKSLGHIGKAVDKAGGLGKSLGTAEGRKGLAEGVGKAAPSIAAGTGYTLLGKKLYDKTLGSQDNGPAYY